MRTTKPTTLEIAEVLDNLVEYGQCLLVHLGQLAEGHPPKTPEEWKAWLDEHDSWHAAYFAERMREWFVQAGNMLAPFRAELDARIDAPVAADGAAAPYLATPDQHTDGALYHPNEERQRELNEEAWMVQRLTREAQAADGIYWKHSANGRGLHGVVLRNAMGDIKIIVARRAQEIRVPSKAKEEQG